MSVADKLKTIAENERAVYNAGRAQGVIDSHNFRIESGEIVIDTQKASKKSGTIPYVISKPLADAKVIVIEADESVKDAGESAATTDGYYYTRSIKVCLANGKGEGGRDAFGDALAGTYGLTGTAYPVSIAEDGTITVDVYSLMGGTYHMKAYYWNE